MRDDWGKHAVRVLFGRGSNLPAEGMAARRRKHSIVQRLLKAHPGRLPKVDGRDDADRTTRLLPGVVEDACDGHAAPPTGPSVGNIGR